MKPPLPRSKSDLPRTLSAQLEVVKAISTLRGPDDDELLRRRHAELSAIRGELEAIKRDLVKAGEECLATVKAELRLTLAKKYNPDQPRVPAGNRDGGQWASGDGEGDSSTNTSGAASERPVRYAALDTNTLTDATAVNYRAGEPKAKIISASEIPADSPGRPVPFLDSAGEPVTIDGNPLLRPYNLPPSSYVNGGAGSRVAEYITSYNEASLAGILFWGAKIYSELAPLNTVGIWMPNACRANMFANIMTMLTSRSAFIWPRRGLKSKMALTSQTFMLARCQPITNQWTRLTHLCPSATSVTSRWATSFTGLGGLDCNDSPDVTMARNDRILFWPAFWLSCCICC